MVVAAGRPFTADQFKWKPDESDEWKTNALGDIEGAWSDQFTFHNTRKYWDTLPNVNVHVDVIRFANRAAVSSQVAGGAREGRISDAAGRRGESEHGTLPRDGTERNHDAGRQQVL